jgi:hypothetical protein
MSFLPRPTWHQVFMVSAGGSMYPFPLASATPEQPISLRFPSSAEQRGQIILLPYTTMPATSLSAASGAYFIPSIPFGNSHALMGKPQRGLQL